MRFDVFGRAELMFRFDSEIDSLTFGNDGTQIENLLFVSHNNTQHGVVRDEGAQSDDDRYGHSAPGRYCHARYTR